MPSQPRQPEEFELLRRNSTDSVASSDSDPEQDGRVAYSLTTQKARRPYVSLESFWDFVRRRTTLSKSRSPRIASRRRRSICLLYLLPIWIPLVLILIFGIFIPSYSRPPERYRVLRNRCTTSTLPGRGNVNNERIFIASSLYDADGGLVDGEWGNSLLKLVDLLGPENVHVSIYENDATEKAEAALQNFKGKLTCNNTLTVEKLPLENIPHAMIPSGEVLPRRIAFLADVRNRAMRSLESEPAIRYDKVLYINDVYFDPVDAVQLLLSTNADENGRTQYRAACAIDFINGFKFYDRFATRDFDGYRLGVPFYPWFTNAGTGTSRSDVLSQTDAVRVRSCWGGMTAFEARWFQREQTVQTELASDNIAKEIYPLRFRFEDELFWEASECCLIHADLTYLSEGPNQTESSGIYTNPYVRVAYDSHTRSWLAFTRRFERLYSLAHSAVNKLLGMPWSDGRDFESPGGEFEEAVWKWDELDDTGDAPTGSYDVVKRRVGPGRFCGYRDLQVLNADPKPGEKRWRRVRPPVPPP